MQTIVDQLPRLGKRELILFTCNYVVSVWRGIPLPLDAWDGLRYFIVAFPEPSINNFTFKRRLLQTFANF